MTKKKKQDAKAKAKTPPKRVAPEVKSEQTTGSMPDNAPISDAPDEVLGTISRNEDAQSDVAASRPKKSMRKRETAGQLDAPEQAEPALPAASAEPDSPAETAPAPDATSAEASAEPEPEPEPERLRLPRGAFVGLRKSGGFRFSTREVVVYPDGRVAYDARGVPQKEYTRLRRALNDGQTMSLRKLLDQTNFWKTEGGGQQNPDAFAYEIAARIGQRSNEIEVYDGSIPESLKPLLERLTKLLPE